jgi:hypothetical protein
VSLIQPVLNDPLGVAILTVVVVGVWYYQRDLSWRECQKLHGLKKRFAPLASRLWLTTSEKAYRNKSPEYLATIDQPPREVFETLTQAGGHPHLLNAVKYREGRGGREYMVFAVVFPVGGMEQVEAYVFDCGDGTSDAYVHTESSVLDVDDHLQDGGIPGDPRGIVADALGVRNTTK